MISMCRSTWQRILDFNKTRRLLSNGFNIQTESDMLLEEVRELIEAKTWQEQTDALCDIIVIATGGLYKLDVNPERAMDETIKEIESRLQDPEQAIEWDTNKPYGKWKKWLQQDPSTLYEANYKKECVYEL